MDLLALLPGLSIEIQTTGKIMSQANLTKTPELPIFTFARIADGLCQDLQTGERDARFIDTIYDVLVNN